MVILDVSPERVSANERRAGGYHTIGATHYFKHGIEEDTKQVTRYKDAMS